MADTISAHKIMDQLQLKVEKEHNLDQIVYSFFYQVQAEYFGSKNDFENFYNNSLQYLAYTNETQLTQSQKIDISLKMA